MTFTWGNVSGIDRERNLVVIKPSGVSYERMRVEDMVVLDLAGKRVEGPCALLRHRHHLVLYRAYPELGGVVHTTPPMPPPGPRRAPPSHFRHHPGRLLSRRGSPAPACSPQAKWRRDYEADRSSHRPRDPQADPHPHHAGVLVAPRPLRLGQSAEDAVHNAVVLGGGPHGLAHRPDQPGGRPARLPAGEALPAQATRLLRPDKSLRDKLMELMKQLEVWFWSAASTCMAPPH